MSNRYNPELPDLFANGWGPTESSTPNFSGLPFTEFRKRDTINYIANWDDSAPSRSRQRRPKFGDENAHLGVFDEEEDVDDTFQGGITVKKKSYETIAKYRSISLCNLFPCHQITNKSDIILALKNLKRR